MNIKYLNESFKKLYEEAINEEPVQSSFQSELRTQLEDTLMRLQMRGATNIKEYEIAFQEAIENMEPDKAWWEVTDCNIFFSLFETRSPELTLEQIIAELKPEYKKSVEENLDEFLDADVDVNLDASGSSVGFLGGTAEGNTNESLEEDYWDPLAVQYTHELQNVNIDIADKESAVNELINNWGFTPEEAEGLYNRILDYNNESLQEQLEECLNKLNEATISDEDKKDSDLIRNMMAKIERRSNAKFSPEEQAVLDKYGIKRNNDFKSLDVDGISLDSHVDSENRTGYYTKYNNGNKSMINYADRARKIPQRKDNQAWGPRNRYVNSNDWVNRHNGYKRNPGERKGESPLVHAERSHQNSVMQEPMGQMRNALQNRKFYQGMIDGSRAEYDKAMQTAKKNYDDAVRRAQDTFTHRNTSNVDSRDYAQRNIDKLLKRKPKED